MEFPAGMLVGFVVGFLVMAMLTLFGIQPMDRAEQFKQDCQSMAHGTVLKGSPHVCRKGNTILFTAK